MKKKAMPETLNQKESLTSSEILPEFETLEKEYQQDLASIKEEEEKKEKKKSSRKEISQVRDLADTGENLQVSPDDIEDWVCMPLDMFFSRSGKKVLSNIERIAWSRNCAKLFNKYAPMLTSKYGEEIGAAVCLLTIIAVRMQPPEIKKPEKAEETAKPVDGTDV